MLASSLCCGLGFALGACGAADAAPDPTAGESGDEGTGRLSQPIVGGETDREHIAVLAIATITPDLEARLRECPPVPTTSIYSKTDGVVCWRGCVERKSSRSESIEVCASHLGMVTHPEVLRIVADRLAQPEGKWRPMGTRVRVRKPRAARC